MNGFLEKLLERKAKEYSRYAADLLLEVTQSVKENIPEDDRTAVLVGVAMEFLMVVFGAAKEIGLHDYTSGMIDLTIKDLLALKKEIEDGTDNNTGV